ncbi:Uncharacterized protein OS=Smithella sp. SCADC GN=ER57_03855 PE=4 SV=1 [Tuwongella immobilis]|uniref:Glycosyltransferase RgtA/B/C/D-like domain-containing protein n=2 Tax=Tuwongella immobilis TaxID=692036 RepID=A0A6C2YUC9_9BACT|nr:Uncharacterized protein OS=Smithella sp. SCADC GN=ER57_03855 PE=4 SV=1 [Tuwongella immobilis]VTS06411.1 Uncharacterized protein OS=Smithella sp. SCADC GN=ER57_03855 PE=4 SV=1 [Tuwongella immobilis]
MFLGFALTMLVLKREASMVDPGTYWHVVVGDKILDEGTLPRTDWLTFPFAGQFWVPQQWLGEVIMAITHRLAGFDGLLLMMVTALGMMVTLFFHRLRACGLSIIVAMVCIFLTVGFSAYHFLIRPIIFTMLAMTWMFKLILDFENQRISIARMTAWLIPLGIIWTNIHGGVLAGIVTLWLAIGGWCLAAIIRFPTPIRTWADVGKLVAMGVAFTLTPLVNPLGFDLFKPWVAIMGSKVLPKYVIEHSPLNLFKDSFHLGIFCFGLFYTFMLISVKRIRPKVSWVIPLVWFALTIKSIRQGPLFASMGILAMADFLPWTHWYARLKTAGPWFIRPDDAPPIPPMGWRVWVIPGLFVALCAGLQMAKVPVPVIGSGWIVEPSGVYPVEMLPQLKELNDRSPDGTPIFNDSDFGGYLSYHLPRLRIFMDDRYELCGDEWLENYAQMLFKEPERFDGYANQWPFQHAIIDRKGKLRKYLDQHANWEIVQESDCAAWFTRKAKPDSGVEK